MPAIPAQEKLGEALNVFGWGCQLGSLPNRDVDVSNSGHKATKPSSSRSIMAVKRRDAFMGSLYWR